MARLSDYRGFGQQLSGMATLSSKAGVQAEFMEDSYSEIMRDNLHAVIFMKKEFGLAFIFIGEYKFFLEQ